MSTKVMRVGITRARLRDRRQPVEPRVGHVTSPTFGSMVQKGKFAACAAAVRVSALKSVDLPTFGSPTIPTFSAMPEPPRPRAP